MNHVQAIITIAQDIGAQTYLEIGVRNPADCMDIVSRKVPGLDSWGVAPSFAGSASCPHQVLPITSDQFFETLAKHAKQRKRWRPNGKDFSPVPKKFDLIYIDGDHSYKASAKDMLHAVTILGHGGIVVMHDVLPTNEHESLPTKPAGGRPWCGEVWATWANHVMYDNHFVSDVLNTDHGIGLIRLRTDNDKAKNEQLNQSGCQTWRDVAAAYVGAREPKDVLSAFLKKRSEAVT